MCDSPFYKRIKGHIEYVPFDCGRCPPCRRKRINQWVFRLKQQEKVSVSARFVTLTYDTSNVPISSNGFMTLDRSHFQLFMKRLRKKHEHFPKGLSIKYYAVGEYGDQNERPHFHAIMFNVKSDESINEAWAMGNVVIGTVSGASIAYTAKYIDKQARVPKHSRDDRVPEFSLMSKGLGKNYLTRSIRRYHKADLNRNYVTDNDGNKIALPKYYRDRLYDETEKRIQRYIIKDIRNKRQLEKSELAEKLGITVQDYEFAEKQARYLMAKLKYKKRSNHG